jgi:hypothetical protein
VEALEGRLAVLEGALRQSSADIDAGLAERERLKACTHPEVGREDRW